MTDDFINLTEDSISREHLCCIIRSKKPHPGVECKRAWLADRLKEGHVFRKLNAKGCCFIEYAPLETAWVPVLGDNYIYIYCLWANAEFKGRGYGRELMEYCIADARAKGKSGVCMLGAKKQKNWLSDQSFAKKYGFACADRTEDGYELLALSFDGTLPRFADAARSQHIDSGQLTVYYGMQCPFIPQKIDDLKKYCAERGIPAAFHTVDTLEKAKSLPCVFNNFAYFCKGSFGSVNLLDTATLDRLLKR